jgi:hypothetical protein
MRWVDVPFTISGDRLYTQKTEWPQRCACCGGSSDGSTSMLHGRLQTEYVDTGAYRSESGFSVGFPVPYCQACQQHAGPVSSLRTSSWVAGFFLWVLVGWILFVNGLGESVIGVIVFVLAAALIGVASHLVSIRLIATASTARMKPECSGSDYAVSVSPHAGSWRFEFHSDAYAGEFARLNSLPLLAPAGGSQ